MKRRKKSELTKGKEKLWELCKKITRKRYQREDGLWTCYTSEVTLDEPSRVQTGHFIPSSLCSMELRYDLKNLRPQSFRENINHSGNPHQYRRNLIRDHGEEYVKELEERNEKTKGGNYGLFWIKQKIEEYEKLLKSCTPIN